MRDFDKQILNKSGKELRILMVGNHVCIRVIKRMRALKRLGYKIDGLGNRVSYGTNDFDMYSVFQNEKQFKNYIKDNMDKYDIIDYSNEPDYPVKWIRDTVGDKVPIVVDLHDLDNIRKDTIPIDERKMFNSADALIYVSQPIQKIANELHSFNKPNIVLYSYCNDGVIDYDPSLIHERKGLVYEGGGNPPNDKMQNQVFPYRNIHPIIKRLVEMGNETHMYCGNISAYNTYQFSGAVLYPPLVYDELMGKMIKHKYGVVMFNNKDGKQNQVNYTLTNKEEEYLQCGIPSLVCWAPETAKHVEKHGIGFTFNDIEEVGDCSQLESKYMEVMDNIKTKRKELVMENYIWKLENLYAELLGTEKKGIPDNIRKLNDFEYGKEDTNKLLI